MITTNLSFFILVAILVGGFSVYFTFDYTINYKTWGDNEGYFKTFEKFKTECDVNYFSAPTNCKVVYLDGSEVPDEILIESPSIQACSFFENSKRLPCRMN